MFLVSFALRHVYELMSPWNQLRIDLLRARRYKKTDPEWNILNQFVDKSRAAVDVGAHAAMYAGRLVQLSRRVYCFEPLPHLAADLKRKLPKSARIFAVGLSDKEGWADLRVPMHDGAPAFGLASVEPRTDGGELMVFRIPLRRLDELVQEPVGFIKIDVEGHELKVLQGALSILTTHKPNLLIESEKRHNEDAPENVFRFLEALGYQGLFLTNGALRPIREFDARLMQNVDSGGTPIGTYVNNFFFVSPAHVARLTQ
jgi:FkbM family methyltransferase